MSIFFPDNDKRKYRLIELSSDAQNFLTDAKSNYQVFTALTTEVNQKIAAVYQKAGLTAPAITSVDILQAEKAIYNVATADTIVAVSNIILDLGGMAATIAYFAPAATALLVDSGAMAAETASAVLFSVLGAEVTAGALVGGIVGGLVVGIIVVGIGLAVDAYEGYELRDQLRKGIYQTDQIRASLKFSQDKTHALVGYLQSVKTTCDSLLASSIELTDAVITNIIQKNAIPALQAIEEINKDSVLSELQALDKSRNSWTSEDESGSDLTLPDSIPVYIQAGVEVPESLVPAIPDGLKLTALVDPDHLDLKINYPILKVQGVQYWPFSYIDNRDGMAIVAFDNKGNILRRWDETGARYIWQIQQDVNSTSIDFIGQDQQKIVIPWSQLTNLSFNAAITINPQSCPPLPADLKLTALTDPDCLQSPELYPVFMIGNVQYWPLSYQDNRNGMAILAFDTNGKLLKRWDKNGARYIWQIQQNLGTQQVFFIGQANQQIAMSWSDLNTIS